jgi:hypothetical protein
MPKDKAQWELMFQEPPPIPNGVAEHQLYLTEEDFTKNIGKIIGYECSFFGKILYIYMAEGFDRKKISYLTFL